MIVIVTAMDKEYNLIREWLAKANVKIQHYSKQV